MFAVIERAFSYFRHYLNLVILWSIWSEFELIEYVPFYLRCIRILDFIACLQREQSCMGPGNWRLAHMVDEIPNVVPHLPPPDTQSFLVLSHLAHCDKVIHQVVFIIFLLIILQIIEGCQG